MQNYTLSERDIIELIGAAGNAVCEDRIFPQGCDLLIMEISAEISKRLIGHLSGSNPFPEDVLKIMTVLLKKIDGGEDDDAGCQDTADARTAASGRTGSRGY